MYALHAGSPHVFVFLVKVKHVGKYKTHMKIVWTFKQNEERKCTKERCLIVKSESCRVCLKTEFSC